MPGVCPRCNREVYFAEERLALGKVWHTFCFSCKNCRKLLDSCSVATHCGELFCKNCHAHLTPRNARSLPDKVIRPIVSSTSPSSPSTLTTATVSESTNYRCSCRTEDRLANDILPNEIEHYRSVKSRLRGGGSKEEERNCSLEEDGHSENGCTNVDIVHSISTAPNSVSSPIAVTTWYNRQHSNSTSRSSPGSESHSAQKSNTVLNATSVKDERCTSFEEANDIPESGSRVTSCSFDNGTEGTEIQLSGARIPSRRKFPYPPVPPPRSPLRSRRRVSFCDAVFGDRRGTPRMQDGYSKLCCNNGGSEQHGSTYDVWRADEATGKSDGGYETNFVTDPSNDDDHEEIHFRNITTNFCDVPENLANGSNNPEEGHVDRCTGAAAESCINGTMTERDIGKNIPSKEEVPEYSHALNTIESDDDERMRGGCGRPGSSATTSRKNSENDPCMHCTRQGNPLSNANSNALQERQSRSHNDSFHHQPPKDCCRNNIPSCTSSACSSPCSERRGHCATPNEAPVCKKTTTRCRQPCTGDPENCGAGGCCGSGCRGGCGKPGQTCMPSRPCTTPPCRPHSPTVSSPCSATRTIAQQPPCCRIRSASATVEASREPEECRLGKFGNCCGSGGGTSCCRSRVRTIGDAGCCSSDGGRPATDRTTGVCSRVKFSGCECLGGGLDCQRCGRKVYQAEMQIASGVPYHNICFSCFCCRKPLEPLTYQENCGEIYCKQCYVRNFGPQGYGYGLGAGALQTPL